MPHYVIPYAILLPSAFAVAYLVTVHYRKRTLEPLGVGFLCALSGAFLWLMLIGPVLLLKP